MCVKTLVLRRFLRIQAVQKVIHNPTQLSGRGFPHIFYMRSILSQFYVLLMLQNGCRAEKTCFIMLHNACFPFRTTLPHALTPPERCASPSEYDTFFSVCSSLTTAELRPFPFENLSNSQISAGLLFLRFWKSEITSMFLKFWFSCCFFFGNVKVWDNIIWYNMT